MLDHAWCFADRFGALARGGPALIFSHLDASHSHRKWDFRVTVGGGVQISQKGERSVHTINVAVSLDTGTGFAETVKC